jgi:hypothetical protein
MNKKVKIVFDPAFFEAFNGTQEELEQVMAEIRAEFESKSIEEIRAVSKEVDWDELDSDEARELDEMLERHKSGNGPTLQ